MALEAEVNALQERLNMPPKTPENSSVPPAKGFKADRICTPEKAAIRTIDMVKAVLKRTGKPGTLARVPGGLRANDFLGMERLFSAAAGCRQARAGKGAPVSIHIVEAAVRQGMPGQVRPGISKLAKHH